MNMNNEIVVVTGVSSFIGMHLACFLTKHYRHVIGTCSGTPSAYGDVRLARLRQAASHGVRLVEMNLTQPSQVHRLISRFRPAIWVHHAGYADGYASAQYDLDKGHRINVAPLEGIYSRLKHAGCKGIVLTGTCMEYGDTDRPCREDDPCLPATPYGLSKLAETLRARQLSLHFSLPTRVVRVFNPFGPMDAPAKLLPYVITALRDQRTISLTHCRQQRDFIHVQDLVEGYLACIQDLSRDCMFDIFNLCSGEATVVKDFLLYIAERLQADPSCLQFGQLKVRPGEADICYGSRAKAWQILGWKPQSLESSINLYLQQALQHER